MIDTYCMVSESLCAKNYHGDSTYCELDPWIVVFPQPIPLCLVNSSKHFNLIMSPSCAESITLRWEQNTLPLSCFLSSFLSLCLHPLFLSSLHYPLTTLIPQPSEEHTLVIYKACCVSPGDRFLLDSISHHEATVQFRKRQNAAVCARLCKL